MKKLLIHFILGFFSLYLATLIVPGVRVEGDFKEGIKILVLAGILLGSINYFIKPIINLITFPLRIITFGLFGVLINMTIVWGIDILLPQLTIEGIAALFWTTLLVWAVGSLTNHFF